MSQITTRVGGGGPVGPAIETITVNHGANVIAPVANNINLNTANATVNFTGATPSILLDFAPISNNVVLGSSLPALTVGSQSVGLGNAVLASLTAGVGNTALGFNAGQKVTTGNANTAVGNDALNGGAGVITGSSNSAFGNDALNAITSGSDNTALGDSALVLLTTGSGNTCIGSAAGIVYTTESNNIVIGNLPGVAADASVTRIDNIYGTNVGVVNAQVVVDNTGKLGTAGGGIIQGSVTTIGAVTADMITIALGAVAGTFGIAVRLVAFESTTPAGAGYQLIGAFRTDGATATLIGTVDQILNEDAALVAGDATMVVSANNVIVRVTGVAGLTINWAGVAEIGGVF